jgi:hypothetical protein
MKKGTKITVNVKFSLLKHHTMGRLGGVQVKLLVFWPFAMNRDDCIDRLTLRRRASERTYALDKRHGGFQSRSQGSGDGVGDRTLPHSRHSLSCQSQCQYVRYLHHKGLFVVTAEHSAAAHGIWPHCETIFSNTKMTLLRGTSTIT